MSRPEITIHNAETDEIITREMTDDEFSAFQERQQAKLEKQNLEKQKQDEKNALLEKLGITAEEAKLLLS